MIAFDQSQSANETKPPTLRHHRYESRSIDFGEQESRMDEYLFIADGKRIVARTTGPPNDCRFTTDNGKQPDASVGQQPDDETENLVYERKIRITLPFWLPMQTMGETDGYYSRAAYADFFIESSSMDNLVSAGFDTQRQLVIGRWPVGNPEPFAWREVFFDPQFGGRPVEVRWHYFKDSQTFPWENKSAPAAAMFERTTSEWKKVDNVAQWLPVKVTHFQKLNQGVESAIHTIDWWLDEEVPDDVFSFADFSLSCVEGSVLDRLIEKRLSK